MSKKIAIPTSGKIVDAHFGKAIEFTVFEVEGKDAKFVEVLSAAGLQHQHEGLASMFKRYGVDVLVCGGVGGGMIDGLKSVGLEVVTGASGNLVEVAKSYASGDLVSTGSVCQHHDDDHDHHH